MLTFKQLSTPVTRDQALATMLTMLGTLGFTVTSWQSGDPVLTILMVFAELYAQLTIMVAALVRGRHNATATGEFLDAVAESDYGNSRQLATSTRLTERFSLLAGEASIVLAIGDMVIAKDSDPSITYRNIQAGTIPSGGSVDLIVECELAGTRGNAANGTVRTLITSFAGVSVTNIETVLSAVDAEADDRLRLRNVNKWPTLSLENTADAIAAIVTNAVPGVTQVAIDASNPRGAGTVDIYCAGSGVAAGSLDVDAAQVAARKRYFNPDPRIQCFATPEEIFEPDGSILFDPTIGEATTKTNVEAVLLEMLRVLPIGGRSYTNGATHVLLRDDFIKTVKSAQGVIGFTSSTPAGNVAVGEWSKLIAPTVWAFSYAPTVVT